MTVKITPSRLKGGVTPPPSKSVTHRALICAALSGGRVVNPLFSDDITATDNALKKLKNKSAEIDCGESGSTLRFLIPLFAVFGTEAEFRGRGELPNRSIEPYLSELPKHGVIFETASMPYRISGRLSPGEYRIGGDISSQFITGLLLALPLLNGDSKIVLTSPLQSKPYADITLDVMRQFGVIAEEERDGYFIKGDQNYIPCEITVEADMSQAAFFAVANKLGAEIDIRGLNMNSKQGDKAVFDIINSPAPYNIDAANIPDIVPALAVLCSLTGGEHRIYNCSRLRIKESDRLEAISCELNKIGGNVRINEKNELIITGAARFNGGVCSSRNDHRIAMSLTIAAINGDSPVIIENAECVNKSYVNFFDDIRKLGGAVDVLNV